MADVFEVECPCCSSVLQIDPETKTVLRHQEVKRKPLVEDLTEAVQHLKGEADRRADVFAKSFDAHLNSEKVREKKFEELLKQAKEDTSKEPPKRAFDFD